MPIRAEFPATLPATLSLVGEAAGMEEEKEGRPFIGPSGQLLNKALNFINLPRENTLVTNVFMNRRPRNNNVMDFFLTRNEAKGVNSPYPAYRSGENKVGILRPEDEGEIARLDNEISASGCRVAVALGNTAMWALTGHTKIGDYRGTILPHSRLKGVKVLPTYHPAAILREWSLRPKFLADLQKALAETKIEGIQYPQRTIIIPERISDLHLFDRQHLQGATYIAMDVETKPSEAQITCLSLAPSSKVSLVIPIWGDRNDGSYWTLEDELQVWLWLKEITSRDITFLFHNAVYDLTYLRQMFILPNKVRDTMLMHHAYQPEWRKSLGDLGSLYCNERAWKNMRVGPKYAINKGDE